MPDSDSGSEARDTADGVLRALRYAAQRVQMLPPSLSLSLSQLDDIRTAQSALDAALVEMVMRYDENP